MQGPVLQARTGDTEHSALMLKASCCSCTELTVEGVIGWPTRTVAVGHKAAGSGTSSCRENDQSGRCGGCGGSSGSGGVVHDAATRAAVAGTIRSVAHVQPQAHSAAGQTPSRGGDCARCYTAALMSENTCTKRLLQPSLPASAMSGEHGAARVVTIATRADSKIITGYSTIPKPSSPHAGSFPLFSCVAQLVRGLVYVSSPREDRACTPAVQYSIVPRVCNCNCCLALLAPSVSR